MELLKSIIPELKYRRLSYDIADRKQPPIEGEYLVSVIGKRGAYKAGTVYQVAAVREVSPKKPRPFTRWHLTVIICPDMYQLVGMNIHTGYAWIDGQTVHPIFWHPRKKK